MSKDMDLIEVGRTAGAYGVRGWLRVVCLLYTSDAADEL